ncbi:MAG TPA: DUF3168 domain-containing protein [Allosphingosinicella sp.]|jgi:hypothetical protein|nr:DUF3168 domain-containing protein [Allosphingosinicella sp.]
MTAGEALARRALAALESVAGLNGRYSSSPVQASFPYATVETSPESDWSHKSGTGREVRLAVTLRDRGEQPGRLRRLLEEAEAAIATIGGAEDGWRIVTLAFVRSRVVPAGDRSWLASLDYRARMLAE